MKFVVKNYLTKILLKFALILFINMVINANSIRFRIKNSIINYEDIPFCKSLGTTPEEMAENGPIHKKLLDPKPNRCQNHPDLYAYTKDFYKTVNCYLRSNLALITQIPSYIPESINKISASLNGPSDITIQNLPKNYAVKRFSLIHHASKLTPNSLWKNISFLSSSFDRRLSFSSRGSFNTNKSYLLIFAPKQDQFLKGKKINACSDNPGEREFLLDKGQCWKITNIYKNPNVTKKGKNNKEIYFTSIDCEDNKTYNDL